jgi:raffinose/stachyose/melibiose transport system permease protein
MERVLGNKKLIFFFVFPAFLFFMCIIILPILYSGYLSTLEWNGFTDKVFVGFDNYLEMFKDYPEGFTKGIINSAMLAVLSIFIQVPLALILALFISKGIKGEGFFRTVYFIPVIISTTVIGQLWMKVYQPKYGLLNYLLEQMGLEQFKNTWLASTETALACTFFVIVWQYIGYHMLLLYSAIKSIPKNLYEAAEVDGATGMQLATHITIPLIMPMIKVCTTFALIGSLKTFDLIYVLTKGGPIHSTEVTTTIMYRVLLTENNYGLGSAMAIFIIVECLIFTVFIQKAFKAEAYTF